MVVPPDVRAGALRLESTPSFGATSAPLSRVDGYARVLLAGALPPPPNTLVSGTRGNGFCWIKVGRQKRRVQIALDWPNAADTLMPALGEQLLHSLATAVAPLAQRCHACGNFDQGAARTCNGASQ